MNSPNTYRLSLSAKREYRFYLRRNEEGSVKRPRLLLADAHPLILDGLRRLLEREYEVVGTVTDGRTLVKEARRLEPDLILLDFSLPELTGLEAARQVKKVLPASRLIFWTTYDDPAYTTEAARIGASVYVLTRPTGGLLSSIRKALSQPDEVRQQL